jgi:hypothetical protein
MAAQVGNNHAVCGGETLDHRLEHLAGDHQPVYQQEGRAGAALSEVDQL